MHKLLSQLLPSFAHQVTAADGVTLLSDDDVAGVTVSSLVFDSREVTEGSLYFALPGTHVDGKAFIPQALEKGAGAIVYQGELPQDVQRKSAEIIVRKYIENAVGEKSDGTPLDSAQYNGVRPAFIKVADSRFAMSPISDAFYDSPSKKLIVIGVTGTEGKSSTVSFIWQLLRLAGLKAGFISTVEYSFGGDALPNPQHQTTPEATIIHHHLNEMLENGCQYAVVESSSHGLSARTNRLGNVLFDCGVFMNVTLEHLEFHKTFEQYRNDKANLFRALDKHDHVKTIAGENVRIPSIGVVNLEDASAEYFIKSTKKHVYGFTTMGAAGKAAAETGDAATALPKIPENLRYMQATNLAAARFGLDFTVDADGESAGFPLNYDAVLPREHKRIQVIAKLPGAFNAYNIMAAVTAVSSVTQKSFEELFALVPSLVPVKGRMTVVDKNQPFEVIVDYAHTPSSFETIFPPIKKRCAGRIFAVFGSGGERDLTKRPLQGEIAAQFCDYVVLADEDPRGEDPVALLTDIARGAQKGGMKLDENLFIIHDRKEAIRHVLKMAQKGDIVLLLGKSHENSIIYKDYTMPYDEIAEAEIALSEMGYNGRN